MSKYFLVLLHISHVFSLETCFEDFKLSCRHRAGNILMIEYRMKVVSNYCKHSVGASDDDLQGKKQKLDLQKQENDKVHHKKFI